MFEKPKGGTELMYDELMRRLPPELINKFSIFNYINQADFSKKTIYWNQLSYDQESVQFLKNPEFVDKINNFVFVSHWQSEKFRQIFNIPAYKTTVIKNASSYIDDKIFKPTKKIKICYTSTPWRGLDVLLRSWEILQPNDCELHVFSSTKIYGMEFAEKDSDYDFLYNKCKELPNVIYRGSIPNDELRKELTSFDIMAYPNTFEETSCIAVIEALSAGLRVITSNLGALPETTEGWARIYPFHMNSDLHAKKFSNILNEEIMKIRNGLLIEELNEQISVYKKKWSWDFRYKEWLEFLNGLQ
jgi:glycosyltransferase involved in cell wall biosynthesis